MASLIELDRENGKFQVDGNVSDKQFYNDTRFQTLILVNCFTIGQSSFGRCINLTSITLPQELLMVGARAFSDCYKLAHIVIPDLVKSIENESFIYCSSLATVQLPTNLVSIGKNAFRSCFRLHSINLPDSIQSIGTSAFSGCNSLMINKNLPNNLEILSAGTFSNCFLLERVKIPDKIKKLDNYLFNTWKNLTEVEFGPDITEIGIYCFTDCKKLTRISNLPSVVKIGDHAFENCEELLFFNFSNEIKYIGSAAFKNCLSFVCVKFWDSGSLIRFEEYYPINLSQLTEIKSSSFQNIGRKFIHESYLDYYYIYHYYFRYYYNNYDYSNVYGYEIYIRSNVFILSEKCNSIGDYAFCGAYLFPEFNFSNSITQIGKYAFFNRTVFKFGTLPKSLKIIDENAFNGFYIWSSYRHYTYFGNLVIPSGAEKIHKNAFSYNDFINVTILDSVNSIGEAAFEFCIFNRDVYLSSLTSISKKCFYMTFFWKLLVHPDNLLVIEEMAFMHSVIDSIKLSKKLEVIGKKAFYMDVNTSNYHMWDSPPFLTEIVFPESLYLIDDYAFYDNYMLQKITFLGNNITLGYASFTNVGNRRVNSWIFRSFDYKDAVCNIKMENQNSGDIIFGNNAFSYAIINFTTDVNVNTIEKYCFYNASIFNFHLNQHCHYIKDNAFSLVYFWGSLKSIRFPDNLSTELGKSIFAYSNIENFYTFAFINIVPGMFSNSKIEDLLRNPYLKSVGNYSFFNCSELREIDLGDQLETIGNYAFSQCQKLETVTIPPTCYSIGENAFSQCPMLNITTVPQRLGEIKYQTFANCISIKSINLWYIRKINSLAFDSCIKLESIVIPDECGEVLQYSFSNCISLCSVIVGTFCKVHDNVFTNCFNLSFVYFKNNVIINDFAFKNCENITAIAICDSITINPYAFNSSLNSSLHLLYLGARKNVAINLARFVKNVTVSQAYHGKSFFNFIVNKISTEEMHQLMNDYNCGEYIEFEDIYLPPTPADPTIYRPYFNKNVLFFSFLPKL